MQSWHDKPIHSLYNIPVVFYAGQSGERLCLVLKRDEMEQKQVDKSVPFGSLPGSYLGLVCHHR